MKLSPNLIDMPANQWPPMLADFDSSRLVRLGISAVESVMSEWVEKQPKDTVPPRALAVARQLSEAKSEDLVQHARALSKGCTISRNRTLGFEHRIAESARAALNAALASSREQVLEELATALGNVEEHRLYLYAIKAVYGKEREVRQAIMDAMEKEL